MVPELDDAAVVREGLALHGQQRRADLLLEQLGVLLVGDGRADPLMGEDGRDVALAQAGVQAGGGERLASGEIDWDSAFAYLGELEDDGPVSVCVFGTEGSARWSFTRMNEFEVMIGEGGTEHGYTTVLAGPGHGDYARFQPGAGIPMSFDDLKTIEGAAFLSDAVHGTRLAPSAADGVSAAEICEAIVRSAASRSWEDVVQD